MKKLPSRGLPPRTVIPIVICIALLAAIPIASFLKTGFATNGSSIATTEITTPPPAIAQALAELRARIAKNPRDVEALSALAGLYAQIGKTDTAAQLEGQAVEASPDDVSLREADAALLRAAGRQREARLQLDAILARQPRNADALYERAAIDAALRDHAAERRDMQHFLAAAPASDLRLGPARAMLKALR